MSIFNKLGLLLCCVFLLSSTLSFAGSFTNLRSGDWRDSTIWNRGRLPTKYDAVTIAMGTTVTAAGPYTDCDSLTINGFLDVGVINLTVGGGELWIDVRARRNTECLVNGKLRIVGDWSHQFKVYGNLKFNTGSSFEMTSGQMLIDGAGFVDSLSVPAEKAIIDVSNASEFISTGGLIMLWNPHFQQQGICLKGAKSFYNVTFGNNLTLQNFALRTTNDFYVSESDRPIFNIVQLAYLPNPQRQNRLVLNNYSIGNLTIVGGVLVGEGRLKISGIVSIEAQGRIERDIELNGESEQLFTTFDSTSIAIIKGNVYINTGAWVTAKLNLQILNGTIQFTRGKFVLGDKTLTLETPPVGVSSSSYFITYSPGMNPGALVIKNLTGKILFPVGTIYDYLPVFVTATNGDYGVSAQPLSVWTGDGAFGLTNQWAVNRLSGSGAMDLSLQWNWTDESTNFAMYRKAAILNYYDGSVLQPLSSSKGISYLSGGVFGISVQQVNSASIFTIVTKPYSIVYDCPSLQKNIGDKCGSGSSSSQNDWIQSGCVCKGDSTVRVTPVTEVMESLGLIIVPNPVVGETFEARLLTEVTSIVELRLYNSLGLEVKRAIVGQGEKAVVLKVGDLENGVYWLQAFGEGVRSSAHGVVVQR